VVEVEILAVVVVVLAVIEPQLDLVLRPEQHTPLPLALVALPAGLIQIIKPTDLTLSFPRLPQRVAVKREAVDRLARQAVQQAVQEIAMGQQPLLLQRGKEMLVAAEAVVVSLAVVAGAVQVAPELRAHLAVRFQTHQAALVHLRILLALQ
jgi:hypothetical protein